MLGLRRLGVPAAVWVMLLFLCWLAPSASQMNSSVECNTTCQSAQLASMRALFTALGARPAPAGTFTFPNLPEHCSWGGVNCCNSSGLVAVSPEYSSAIAVPCFSPGGIVSVNLPYQGLTGILPDSPWSELAASMQIIDLTGNLLRGTIPANLSQLTGLQYLRLGQNRLSGSIPAVLFQKLVGVSVLALDHNLLTGSIPAMGALQSLSRLLLSSNFLVGSIPGGWLSSPQLAFISLEDNSLTGSFPATPTEVVFTRIGLNIVLNARSNKLSGTLPANFGLLPFAVLDLGQNNLFGNLSELDNMAWLQIVRVDSNRFTGQIPVNAMGTSKVFDLSRNALTGSLPTLSSVSGQQLYLHANELTGHLPDVAPNATTTILAAYKQGNVSWKAGTYNDQGDKLPNYLSFVKASQIQTQYAYMQCYLLTGNPKVMPSLQLVYIDPAFYNFQGCSCMGEHRLQQYANGTAACEFHADFRWEIWGPVIIVLIIIFCAGAVGLVVWWCTKAHRVQYVVGVDKAAPPDEGQSMTLVVTDVEGSTELWEWDNEVMMQAQTLHDKLLRKLLRQFNGYEVATEGDAFIVAFHEAKDALAWCAATQQALLTVDWPLRLQEHARSCVRLYPECLCRPQGPAAELRESAESDYPQLAEVNPKDILFWGLNVRMALASGVCQHKLINETTKRVEYTGGVMALAKGLGELPWGGQIVMDGRTFDTVKTQLADLCEVIPKHIDMPAMFDRCRMAGSTLDISAALTSTRSSREFSRASIEKIRASFDKLRPTPALQRSDLYTPSSLSQEIAPAALKAACSPHPPSLLQSLKARLPALLVKTDSTKLPEEHDDNELGCPMRRAVLRHFESDTAREAEAYSRKRDMVTIIDMGTHMLPRLPGLQLVVQLLVPGLEERARAFAPLISSQHTPGYFEAPATLACPLRMRPSTSLPEVTVVFCSIENFAAMRQANEVAAELVLMLFQSEVRKLLVVHDGYECSEGGGEHMLAFHSPMAAIQYCLGVQEFMMQKGQGWTPDVLALPGCSPEMTDTGRLIWYGPRVRMGMFEGIPTTVMPHITSGRADYFGMLINRAARYANGAARGGQIMLPLAIAQKLVKLWTGRALDLADPSSSVALLEHPGYRLQHVPTPLPQWPAHTEAELGALPPPGVVEPAPSRTARRLSSRRGAGGPGSLVRVMTSKVQRSLRNSGSMHGLEATSSSDLMLGDVEAPLSPISSPTSGGQIGADRGKGASEHGGAAPVDKPAAEKSGAALVHLTAVALPAGPPASGDVGKRRSSHAMRWSDGVSALSRQDTSVKGRKVYIHHCGTCHVKGISEPQTIMAISSGNLAYRTYPASYPSPKAKLEEPFQGLKAIICLPLS